MTPFEELVELLGEPHFDNRDPAAWNALEGYLGSELPPDYKAFLDAYGSGMVANTLIVTHPACEPDAVAKQMRTQQSFTTQYDEAMQSGAVEGEFPYPFHPVPGGLIYWGNGGEDDINHFFLPCAQDPAEWKIVSLLHDHPHRASDASFTAFVLELVTRWITPLSEDEWEALLPPQREWRTQSAAEGLFTPGFMPFW
jgi:hypothetical protein